MRTALPLAVSILALTVSVGSLYLSQLRSADIAVYSPPFMYVHEDTGSITAVQMTLTFTNSGARMGIVRNVALLVKAPQAPGQLMQLAYFAALTGKREFEARALPAPIAVDGRGIRTEHLHFISPRFGPKTSIFTEVGRYDVSILIWDSLRDAPRVADSFGVEITQGDLEEVASQRAGKTTEFIELFSTAWRDWKAGPLHRQERPPDR